MNYYPFHMGDYAAHTMHLEPMEDLAYRRMLDLYYLRESPLPADITQVARLVRLRANSGDVEAVLKEFFVLTEAGWVHERCDKEITHMQDKQASNEDRESHEKERMRRHRERRAEMFEALRLAGIVPAWDVAMKELQRLFDANCNAPATHLQRVQVVIPATPATAIPTPTPTPTPTPVNSVTDVTATDGGMTQSELTKAELWTAGKSLLAAQGMPKAQCGSFVGKLVKDYGDGVVIDAVQGAVVTRPVDAASYIVAACQTGAGQRKTPNKQEALEKRNRQVAEEMIAEMAGKVAA